MKTTIEVAEVFPLVLTQLHVSVELYFLSASDSGLPAAEPNSQKLDIGLFVLVTTMTRSQTQGKTSSKLPTGRVTSIFIPLY